MCTGSSNAHFDSNWQVANLNWDTVLKWVIYFIMARKRMGLPVFTLVWYDV